jgi:antitoxin component YwqK of YwqJK toxin-antitoxin module
VDSKIEYRDGEFDGSFERYYFDGKLLAKGSYSMGVRCGEWIDEGGQPTQMTYPPCSSN